MWKRFTVRWTPTVLILGPDGYEARRVEGFLPVDDLLAQLEMGLGFLAVYRKDWPTARQWFDAVVKDLPDTAAAPEALYWSGVARYSASHDAKELKELGRAFKERYTETEWAKRASIW